MSSLSKTTPSGFVIYGAMRTGSNYLVSLLNQFEGVVCHGEAFNPGFVGLRDDYYEDFGLSREEPSKRDVDVEAFYIKLLDRANPSHLCGFKLFPAHNDDILQRTLADPSLLKIVLKRDLLTSFISLCQAEKTGVWMIQDSDRNRREQQRAKSNQPIHFDGQRFLMYQKKVSAFYSEIDTSLQSSESRSLELWYRQLSSTGKLLQQLADFLGKPVPDLKPEALLTKQNTTPPHNRVLNVQEMVKFLDAHGYSSGVVDDARGTYPSTQP